MSYCKEEGKDRVIFITKEDEDKLIKETEDKPCTAFDGDQINWSSPCVGGGTQLEKGPCVSVYREAFSCFLSNKDDQDSLQNCYEKFVTWQDCMAENPDDYDKILKDMDEEEKEEESKEEESQTS